MGYSQPRRLEERAAREFWLALGLLVVALAQSALLPRPLGRPLNLLLLVIVCHALLAGAASAARLAFYGGISLDLCANSLLGSHALALLAATLLPAFVLARLSRGNWIVPILGVMLGAVAYYALLALITALAVAPIDLQAYFKIVVLPGVLIAAIPSLPLFLFMRWIAGRRRGEVPVDVY